MALGRGRGGRGRGSNRDIDRETIARIRERGLASSGLPARSIQTQFVPFQDQQASAPQTGLFGGENALRQGLSGQLASLGRGIGSAQGEIDLATQQSRRDINQGFGLAAGALDPFAQHGGQAAQLQAAQSGALGSEAEAQFFRDFQNSPGQQFALEQAEQASLRNAASTQGTGGGNLQRELQRQAIGFAQQNSQQRFNNLGQVVGTGQQAANTQAGLFGQQGLNLANISQAGGANLSNLAFQGGVLPAQAIGSAASNISNQRFVTGQQIAQAAGGTTTGLANLQNQLGLQSAGVSGQGAANLSNIVTSAGAASSQLQQNLATILANIGTGSASQAADTTLASGQFDAAGILGQNTAVQNALSQLIELFPQNNNTEGSNRDEGV